MARTMGGSPGRGDEWRVHRDAFCVALGFAPARRIGPAGSCLLFWRGKCRPRSPGAERAPVGRDCPRRGFLSGRARRPESCRSVRHPGRNERSSGAAPDSLAASSVAQPQQMSAGRAVRCRVASLQTSDATPASCSATLNKVSCVAAFKSNLKKADSTLRSSRAVPHPSTNRALRRLTSEVERDPAHSTRYGRQR